MTLGHVSCLVPRKKFGQTDMDGYIKCSLLMLDHAQYVII
jgi:hypothetical protein